MVTICSGVWPPSLQAPRPPELDQRNGTKVRVSEEALNGHVRIVFYISQRFDNVDPAGLKIRSATRGEHGSGLQNGLGSMQVGARMMGFKRSRWRSHVSPI